MKDLICPTCNTRNVPFWPVFWGIGPFKTVRCAECGTRVKHGNWGFMLFFHALYIPAMVIGIPLLVVTVEYPLLGLPFLLGFLFGLNWLQAVVLKLKPVEEKKKEKERTP
jgi:uncharacterized membrane protein